MGVFHQKISSLIIYTDGWLVLKLMLTDGRTIEVSGDLPRKHSRTGKRYKKTENI